jgi:DNA-binding NarL/FixJ family response regulator
MTNPMTPNARAAPDCGCPPLVSPASQAAVVAAAAAAPQPEPATLAALDSRDREILGLLARGLTTGQVAARLFLAPKTIRNRVSDMLDKLGVTTRDQAIALARANGLGS